MRKQELWKKVSEEEHGRIAGFIFDLYERWQDEHEYEDINEYLKFLQRSVPEAYKIHGNPFGITAKCDDGDIRITVVEKEGYAQLVAKSV